MFKLTIESEDFKILLKSVVKVKIDICFVLNSCCLIYGINAFWLGSSKKLLYILILDKLDKLDKSTTFSNWCWNFIFSENAVRLLFLIDSLISNDDIIQVIFEISSKNIIWNIFGFRPPFKFFWVLFLLVGSCAPLQTHWPQAHNIVPLELLLFFNDFLFFLIFFVFGIYLYIL